ncbi:MAG: hypothetical protein K0S28_2041 [Paucimonas sp.]|nr:hypothetical protein [Paucimonas sp.]
MWMRCPAVTCRRPFQVNQFKGYVPADYESGKITCPHCATVLTGDQNSTFLTHALLPSDESRFIEAESSGTAQE